MDEASIEETAPFSMSQAVNIWHELYSLRVPHLEVLSLRVWEMCDMKIMYFLSKHKHTLRDLRLGDCVVLGHLKLVLFVLQDSRSLDRLWLYQIGQNFHRVEFPTTCRASARESSRNDWLWVSRMWYEVEIMECGHWRSRLQDIMGDIEVTSRLVDPMAWDAQCWA
jgi:hypothetical protein